MRRVCLLLIVVGCAGRWQPAADASVPTAALGRCGSVDRDKLCSDWSEAVRECDGADAHDALPERVATACFVPVSYEGDALPRPGRITAACGYPANRDATVATLRHEAARLSTDPPLYLQCELAADVRAAASAANARTLRALAARLEDGVDRFAYAAAGTFGFGASEMSDSTLVSWRPGDACTALDKIEMDRLGINVIRAARAAAAYHGGVAPVVTVSGGAVHATLVEAFMLSHLISCRFDVPPAAVLVDPCADHTHTNVRNTGDMIIGLGGRTGYVVTTPFQGAYMQEGTAFALIGGSIDQRALRDWGYLIGTWRQASVGFDEGFWLTPYRFFGDPLLVDATCVR